MNAVRSEILVGIDVGGSKTHVRIEAAHDGNLIVDAIHTSTDWSALNDAERSEALAALVMASVEGHGSVAALVAGVHGNDSPQQEVILTAPLAARYPLVRVINDSHLLILAHGQHSGTGVIAGTGSSATATIKPDGVLTVGGWGWVLGDEGGAVGLVRDAARNVLEAYDRAEVDPLSEMLLGALELGHPHELPHVLSTVEPRLWAIAAHAVFSAAQDGSKRAQAVIDAHAQALADMVALLQSRGGDVRTIVCAGGVITSQPALFSAFVDNVRTRIGPSAEVALLTEPPVTGAMHLARQLYAEVRASQPLPNTSINHRTNQKREGIQ